MKLSNIRPVARMENRVTGQMVNVKKGHRPERGTDHYFYLLKGQRVWISDADLSNNWTRVQGTTS